MTVQFNRTIVVTMDTIQVRSTVDNLGQRGLDVAFRIEKSLKKNPNRCELQIWNLNEDHRAQLQEREDIPVRVEVGYDNQKPKLLFLGNLREAASFREGPDIRTEINSGDGEKKHRGARVNETLPPGATVQKALDILSQKLGIGTGNLARFSSGIGLEGVSKKFGGGAVLSGNASRELDALIRSAGLEYSIQDNQIQITQKRQSVDQEAVLLSPDTGLIGSPARGSDGIVEARSLLNADLQPAKRVRFESREVTGFFRVEKVEFFGEIHGNDWFADLECLEI